MENWPIARDIIRCISGICVGHARYIVELEGSIEILEAAMNELKNISNDIRRRIDIQEANQMTRTHLADWWLQRIESMEAEVDKLLTEGKNETAEACIRGICTRNCCDCFGRSTLLQRVEQKMKLVAELKAKLGDSDIVAEALVPVEKLVSVPLVARDSIFEEAWSWISEEQLGIMGIHGIAGVGKTAFMKRLHEEFFRQGTLGFDIVIWVEVTKEVNTTTIQDKVAKRIGLSMPLDASLEDRVSLLFSALSKKKFVLLLDDVWESMDLTAIGIPPPNNIPNSMIIFTTRWLPVCRFMEAGKIITLECLDRSDAWKFFEDNVGEQILKSHPVVPEVVVHIVEICGGLPLALAPVTKAMSYWKNIVQWQHAAALLESSGSGFLDIIEEIYPIINTVTEVVYPILNSYDIFDNSMVRSCFLYCCLFPVDFSIETGNLLRYWMGEGFLGESNSLKKATFNGNSVILKLMDAGFLKVIRDQNSATENIMMPALLQNFASWIYSERGKKKEKLLVQAGLKLEEAPDVWKWEEAERISLMNTAIKELVDIPRCPKLLTLIAAGTTKLTKISDNFFQDMKLLRVLDLSSSGIKEFPKSIVNLVNLQYLSLARTEELESIPCGALSCLLKLQVLDLAPSSFGDWKESYVGEGDRACIEELETLKDLKYLSITITNNASLERLHNACSNKFRSCEVYGNGLKLSNI